MAYDHYEGLQAHLVDVIDTMREVLDLMAVSHDPHVFEQLAVWYREEDLYLTTLMAHYRTLLLDLLDVRILSLRSGRPHAG